MKMKRNIWKVKTKKQVVSYFAHFFPHSQRYMNLLGPEDQEMSRVLVDLWTNFAQFHNPTPPKAVLEKKGDGARIPEMPWKKADAKNPSNYVRFEGGKILDEPDSEFDERMKFWTEVVHKKRILYHDK